MENIPAKLVTLLSEWSEIMKKIKPLNAQMPLAGLLVIEAQGAGGQPSGTGSQGRPNQALQQTGAAVSVLGLHSR